MTKVIAETWKHGTNKGVLRDSSNSLVRLSKPLYLEIQLEISVSHCTGKLCVHKNCLLFPFVLSSKQVWLTRGFRWWTSSCWCITVFSDFSMMRLALFHTLFTVNKSHEKPKTRNVCLTILTLYVHVSPSSPPYLWHSALNPLTHTKDINL